MKIFSIIALSMILFISCGMSSTEGETTTETEEVVLSPSIIISDTLLRFENNDAGEIPVDWSEYFTGKGESTKWEIVNDNGNNILAQISNDHPNYHFNVIVFDELRAKNIELQVKLKGVTGKMDQGGGFVWRFIDANNYYVVRANPLEDNIVLYKVENGKRTDLPLIGKGRTYGADVEALGKGWNTLKLIAKDELFVVYLNDKEIFKVNDKTFTNTGKVGLWTKADAVTWFDDFQVKIIE